MMTKFMFADWTVTGTPATRPLKEVLNIDLSSEGAPWIKPWVKLSGWYGDGVKI